MDFLPGPDTQDLLTPFTTHMFTILHEESFKLHI